MQIEKVKKVLEDSWDLLEKSTDDKMVPAMRLLHAHLENPRSYIAFIGETSSGKSTLINALLKRKFLPAGPRPTTGTVTWIEHGVATEEKLYAVNRHASIEEISKEQFRALAEKPDEKLLRLKAELPLSRDKFKGLTIFDTPGFDSIIEQHEEVMKEFLPESDIILFTVAYRIGFGMDDQQMMSLIADMDVKFGQRPVFLVVNRVPEGVTEKDSRIQEIRLHAEDTLHRPVQLAIVYSSAPDPNGDATLPDADSLWEAVAKIAFSEERRQELAEKTNAMLASLLEQRQLEINSVLQAIRAGMAGIPELEHQIAEFRKTEQESYGLIEQYAAIWAKQVPARLEEACEKLKEKIREEITKGNKWADCNSCHNYVYGHLIPFGCKQICHEIEEYLYQQFEELDEKLSEMASTTIARLNDRVQTIQSPDVQKLMTDLGMKIGYKLAGTAGTSIMKSFGGVGGSAAGLGNLVKMLVKNVGGIFKKTFSREVYTQIGKIFTKKLLSALTVALDVVIEAIDYIRESLTWQEDLKKQVDDVMQKWLSQVKEEFSGTMLNDYKKNNIDNVRECYAGMIQDVEDEIKVAKEQHSQSEITELNYQLEHIRFFAAQLQEK